MTDMAFISVPAWARDAADPASDLVPPPLPGAAHLLVGVGPHAADTLAGWRDALAGTPTQPVHTDGLDEARSALTEALAGARVGIRVHIAGTPGDCLALRAVALVAGCEDDEIQVSPTAPGTITIHCLHCESVTTARAGIDDVVACDGCERSLVVHHHVSRLTGHFMGFQVDAETAGALR